jgi:hypothetical protein
VLDVIRAWVACRRPTKFKTVSITLPAASNAQHPPQTVPQRSRLQRPPFVGVTSHGAGARCHSESTNPTSVDEAGEGHHQHRLSDQFYGIACSRHCKESEPRFSNWFGYILTTNCVPRHHHAAGNGTRASPEAEHLTRHHITEMPSRSVSQHSEQDHPGCKALSAVSFNARLFCGQESCRGAWRFWETHEVSSREAIRCCCWP